MRGPLHGIPILIKDNIATADRMMTTAGSLALAGAPAAGDAFIVERLRAAGAVILGKTNLSEWANFRSTHSSSGWSGRGGQTRNPYALDRNPSGSSSGSGAAVAANLARGGRRHRDRRLDRLAVERNGRSSASSRRSASSAGPASSRSRTARTRPGPMARTVADAAVLLGALAGSGSAATRRPTDARHEGTARLHVVARAATACAARASASSATPVRLQPRRRSPGRSRDRRHEDAQGAVIVDPANIPTLGKFDDSEFEVLLYEFKADLNTYLASLRPGRAGALADDSSRSTTRTGARNCRTSARKS